MFTGIVKELGIVRGLSGLGNIYKLSVEAGDIVEGLKIGDSVAVNGACLTLTGKNRNVLEFDVMAESVRRTALGKLGAQDAVNLEDALKAGSPIGGHFVTGHIDCIGRIRQITRRSHEVSIEISFPEEYRPLVVEKGSITLDGISLTVGKVSGNCVTVYIIPHTLEITTLGKKRTGDEMNIEFDLIGKYVLNLAKDRVS
jgi:riboflavin synthase